MSIFQNLSSEEWRSLCLEALRQEPPTQYSSFVEIVRRLAKASGPPAQQTRTPLPSDSPPGPIEEIIQAELWGLVIEGVVVPGPRPETGTHYINQGWPFFHVSPYGARVLIDIGPVPHDAAGYLSKLEEDIPCLDDVTRFYIIEALECFRVGRHLAVAVMVGVAAESALLRLSEALARWLPREKAGDVRRLMEGTKTWKLAGKVKSELEGRRGRSVEIAKLLDARTFEIESLIRATRNEAGHPTGTKMDRDDAYSMLRLLPRQLKLMFDLTKWIDEQLPESAP